MKLNQSFRLLFVVIALLWSITLRAEKMDSLAIKEIFIKAWIAQASDIDSSLWYAKRGLALSKENGYKAGLGMAYMRIGSIMSNLGQNDSALLNYRKALDIRQRLKDSDGAANVCKEISYLYTDLGMRDSAFYYLYEALRNCDLLSDSLCRATMILELAELSRLHGELENSENYLNECLPVFIRFKDSTHVFVAHTQFGLLLFEKDDFSSALLKFQEAEKMSSALNNPVYGAKNDIFIGLCYHKLGELNIAKRYFSRSAQVFESAGLMSDLAISIFNLGTVHMDKGELDSALIHLKSALSLGRTIEDRQRVLRCFEHLALTYADKGDFQSAYKQQVKFILLNDSLLNAEKINSIAEMQTKYETEKKEQAIALLDQEAATKTAQRNALLAGAVVLLLGMILLGFYFIQRQRIARKNEEISKQKITTLINEQEAKTYNALLEGQEEERQRIAADLHDRLGGLLSTVKLMVSALDSKIDANQASNAYQFKKVNSTIDEAVAEVRRISHNLNSGMVSNFGLVPAVEDLVDSIDSSGQIACKLLAYGMEERLPRTVAVTIYRIIQESVNNILKHAKATNIVIQINRTEESVSVTIEDNGVGFDKNDAAKFGGMGLNSLRARATKLKGNFEIDSTPGKGTISIIDIPLNTDAI